MVNTYRGSYLQFDITPNVSRENPAYLQGMACGLRAATAVAVPLSLELCMLEDSNYTKLIIVTADIIGFDKSVVEEVRERAAQWGIGPEAIIMNASHTHYAPGTLSHMPKVMGPFYELYSRQILQIIVSNFEKLYKNLEPCEISVSKAETQIGVNRRAIKKKKVCFAPNAEGAYINDTSLIRVDLKTSRKRILWIAHGCHPTGMGADNRISSDFPGIMKYELKRKRVADGVMFFQGAGGSSKEAIITNGRWKFCDNINEVRQNGMILARSVEDALKKRLQTVNGTFFCKSQRMHLPLVTSESGEVSVDTIQTMPVDIQIVCLGDNVKILTFPMELVAELALKIKRDIGFSDNDCVLGYTNGLLGYLPTDAMLAAGGYEAEQSHHVYRQNGALAAGTEKKVAEAVKKLLDANDHKDVSNAYGRYHRSNGPHKAFFVLSSGRCGTMTLSRLLDTATNAKVLHHPEPFLVEETLRAYHNEIDKRKTFWQARAPFINKAWAKGFIHGETDHNMTPFCDSIAEDIPEAKFLVLVRNPWDFVRSGMRRKYYVNHPWDIGRLRPRDRSDANEKWLQLSQFEKIAWLWSRTYEIINEKISLLKKDRVKIIRFEDLFEKNEQVKEIFDFLELDGFETNRVNPIVNKKFNKQTSGNFPPREEWNDDYHLTLWHYCGKQAELFGYRYESHAIVKE